MDRTLELTWSLEALADALKISAPDVELYFRDGRRISFIVERRFRDARLGWKLAPSEGAGYDLVDEHGAKWEVRSVSKSIYFSPGNMAGSGRYFKEAGILAKLDAIGEYICADITKFPKVPVFIVPSELICRLYRGGQLGSTTLINRERFYRLIVPELEAANRVEGALEVAPDPDRR